MRREREGPGAVTPQGHHRQTQPAEAEVLGISVSDGSVNQAVADKLWRLHTDHGYFTRAELEAAAGLEPPPGRWECAGQFGDDGQWAPHCGGPVEERCAKLTAAS